MRLGLIFISLVVIIRIIVELNSNLALGKIMPNFIALSEDKDWINSVNVDDLELCELAYLSLKHGKYLTNVSFDRPKFRKDSLWITSLRNQFYVIYFSQLIVNYNLYKNTTLDQFKKHKSELIVIHSKIMFFLKYLLLFYNACLVFIVFSKYFHFELTLFGTALFLLYPSTFYIFCFNTFDSLCYPLTVIALIFIFFSDHILNSVKIQRVLIVLFSILSSLVKLHIGLILLSTSIFFVIFNVKRYNSKTMIPFYLSISSIVSIILLLGSINFINSGKFVVSTQSGINFFHGHNPAAKGSWNGNIWNENAGILRPILQSKSKLLSQDEVTESNTYSQMAFDWIISNPIEELKLCIKKIGILIYPHNFLNWNFNIITAISHFSFICFIGYLFKKKKLLYHPFAFIVIPIFTTILLNVYFFVEYRWRFYTEGLLVFSMVFMIAEFRQINFKSIIEKSKI